MYDEIVERLTAVQALDGLSEQGTQTSHAQGQRDSRRRGDTIGCWQPPQGQGTQAFDSRSHQQGMAGEHTYLRHTAGR